jgi:hypothetical protein
MASTYSTNLRTELLGSGDQAGTWGTTTNTSLGSILEQAIAGVSGGSYVSGTYPAVNFPTDADLTLTANNGSVDQSRSAVLVVTSSGSLTATRNVIAPASASKVYIIKNSTTGGQSIQIKYSTGTGVTITNGATALVYGDGTNFNAVTYSIGPGVFTTLTTTSTATIGGNTTIAGTLDVSGNGTFSGTGQVKLPAGTTAQRSGSPTSGMIRYNSTNASFEGYGASSWGSIGGGATGGGTDQVFVENGVTVTTSYTFTTSKNAMSVGPITVNNGAVVTVPSGQRWVIL